MSKQETQTVDEQDVTQAVGQVLKRARNVLFTLPESIKSQRKSYNEVTADEQRSLKAMNSTIRSNVNMIFAPNTDPDTVMNLVKTVNDLRPKVESTKAQAKQKGAEQLSRIQALRTEIQTQKSELEKDFSNATIQALIPTD